jgi:hypothetical protein
MVVKADDPRVLFAGCGETTTGEKGHVLRTTSDAFSLRSGTGAGLWMVLLMSVGYSPLAIYAPLFLQRLHGVSPLGAGYMVALASLAWTTAALSVASLRGNGRRD